jgi:hypothetical protein
MRLQKAFTQVADQLEEYINILTERITHLGGLASVTVRAVPLSVLLDCLFGIVDNSEKIAFVLSRLKLCIQSSGRLKNFRAVRRSSTGIEAALAIAASVFTTELTLLLKYTTRSKV